MESDQIELGFRFFRAEKDEMDSLRDFVSRPYIIVGDHHHLAGRGKISLQELQGENLIVDTRFDHSGVEQEAILRTYGLTPRVILPYSNDAAKRSMVLQGNYVAFSLCPRAWLPYGIVALELMEEQEWIVSSFVKRKGRPLSPAAQLYCDYIIPRFLSEIGPAGAVAGSAAPNMYPYSRL